MARRTLTLADRLKALLSKGHFSILLGAGASLSDGYPLMGELTEQILARLPPEQFPLVHEVWERVKDQPPANIETVLGQLYSLLAVSDATPDLAKVTGKDVQQSISAIQEEIAGTFRRPGNTDTHCRLVERVCHLNSKATALIATSNYDLLIERACEAGGTWCLDGFVGTHQRVWCVESLPVCVGTVEAGRRFRFYRKAVRLLKLHGSVSWATDGQEVVAFPDGRLPEGDRWVRRLVYPSPRKLGEILSEPYSSLLRHFTGAIDRPNSLLVTLGFSYRDSHLVEPIKQFASKPDHTLIALVQRPEGSLHELLERPNVMCLAEDRSWRDGRTSDETLDIWRLPTLVEFLENL